MAEEGGPEAEGVALAAALEAQLEVPVICERMGGVRDMYISTSVYPNRPLIQCQKLTAHVYISIKTFVGATICHFSALEHGLIYYS